MRRWGPWKTCVALLAALALAITAAAALAGGPDDSPREQAGALENARSRGWLAVGIKTDFPPFGYLDKGGNPAGFDVDLARHLAAALFGEEGRLELVPVTSGSRIPLLYSNNVDLLVATVTVTDERRRVLDFSAPYHSAASLLAVPSRSTVHGLADLSGRSVAVVEGSVQSYDITALAPGAKRVVYQKVDEAAAALRAGKVDALFQDDTVVQALVAGGMDLRVAGTPILPRPYAVAVRKGDAATLKWVNERLEAMRKDGTYDRLRKTHFGPAAGQGVAK